MVKISRDYVHFFFRKRLFLKKFAFSSTHDNKSKNYPIVLNFSIDVAFIYLQIEFVAQKYRSITKKIFGIKNFFFNFCTTFSQRILDLST